MKQVIKQAMKRSMRRRTALLGGALCLVAMPPTGIAQTTPPAQPRAPWPARAVRIVHAYPGGPLDAAIRFMAERLSAAWGQPVLVDPRPGANEILSADVVAKSAPDGYTLLIGTEATFANNPYLYRKLPYEPNDLVPVSELFAINFGLIVRGDLPANTVAELIAALKGGARYSYASVGLGNPLHLAMENFKRVAGVEMLHVPYRTTPQAIQDILGGRIDACFGSVQIATPFLASKQMKLLAMTGSTRLKAAPVVPTFTELGLAAVDYRTFVAVAVPRGTPADVVQRIHEGFSQVLGTRETLDKVLDPNGYEGAASDPAKFAASLVARRAAAQRLIRALDVRLD
ncbi:MAG: tripartite tricarboxylate transporter substrate binding protein [Burkholderiales bacterium]|nr:tripartite tricarboxylate transporter substrate binding protein [Burkholderiales bacterium]